MLVFPAAGEKSTGTAIILCSGGGYVRIAINPKGDATVRNLNELGISVFVLKYRLSDYGHPAPFQDVLRAVRTVRSRAVEFGVSPDRIGVMGTSAGGHLSGCAATLWDHPDGKTGAAMDSVNARPDFAVLIYPVVTLSQDFAHLGSREALLGKSPAPGLPDVLSLEKSVRKDSPPFFIVATMADTVVPVMNSLSLYQQLVRAGVPSEMHVYAKGSHGNSTDPQYGPTAAWPLRLNEWLKFNGWLDTSRK
jgi:acetyl esterase/lipase